MFEPSIALPLPKELVERMERLAKSLPLESLLAQRAWIYVMAAEGIPNHAAARALLVNRSTVWRWREKFASGQNPETLIQNTPTPGRRRLYDEAFEKKLVEAARRSPLVSTRDWACRFGVSHMTVHRILKKWGL